MLFPPLWLDTRLAATSSQLHQRRLGECATVNRLESLFDPQVQMQLMLRDKTTMCNLETWFPRHQLDLGSPNRADQHKTRFGTGEAHPTAEAKEPCVANDGTCLLQDLSPEGLLPRLISFGTASWPSPPFAIIAN